MSRTRRVGPVEGFWDTVDAWAGAVVEPSRVRAWTSSRCRLDATSGPYLDLLEDPAVRVRALRDPIGNQGLAVADDDAGRAAAETVPHRRVTAARRYRWNGPALTPVALEVHTTDEEAVLEAWWEDVWAAWPTIRLGRESTQRRSRRATAAAEISSLFEKLGLDPLGRATG